MAEQHMFAETARPTVRKDAPLPRRVALAIAASFLVLTGCATVPPQSDAEAYAAYVEANDPAEPTNRAFFAFNMYLDRYLIKPVATAYRDYLPDRVQDSVEDFLNNLRSPVIFLNDVLQGEGQRAAETFSRFLINSTIGLAGLLDVAPQPAHTEDFGQTLAVWGSGEGPYFVLPLFGPAPPRDVVGLVVDGLTDPFTWLASAGGVGWVTPARTGLRAIDTRSRNIEALDEIERTSIDYYATIRSLYRQRRDDEIRNGEPGPAIVPEIAIKEPGAQEPEILEQTAPQDLAPPAGKVSSQDLTSVRQ
jgi:phospholipid-binding lipoprotein MlaA